MPAVSAKRRSPKPRSRKPKKSRSRPQKRRCCSKSCCRRRSPPIKSYKHKRSGRSGVRVSARFAYDHGARVGSVHVYGGKMHVLTLRRNGSPYWKAI